MSEYRSLASHPEPDFVAGPVDDNLFIWHFIIKGQRDTAFEGGIYHGKIDFPRSYPFSPPDIYFFTPNGRFETHTKLCLNITSYHPDTWNPSWDVRTALLSIIAFMTTKGHGAIGSIDTSDEERRRLAIESRSFHCDSCGLTLEPDDIPEIAPTKTNEEEKDEDESDKKDNEIDDQEQQNINQNNDEQNENDNVDEQDAEQNVNEEELPSFTYKQMIMEIFLIQRSFIPYYDLPIFALISLLFVIIYRLAE